MNYSAIMTLLRNRITYFLLMGVGLLFGAYCLSLDNEDRNVRTTFKPTSCTILESSITEKRERRKRGFVTKFYPEIVYEYEVNGQEYEGDEYRRFEQGMDFEEAVQVVNRFQPGEQAKCYYNPANPEEAVLTLDSDMRRLYGVGFCGLLFLLTGLGGWIVVDFLLVKAPTTPRIPKAAPELEIPAWSSLPRSQGR
jgi:hypothetical protein